jgi:hypothetical protein
MFLGKILFYSNHDNWPTGRRRKGERGLDFLVFVFLHKLPVESVLG